MGAPPPTELKKGLKQLAQEGSIQLFRPPEGREGESIVGAVGELQFDVVEDRLENEYSVKVRFERLSFKLARWVEGEGVPLADLEGKLFGYGALDAVDDRHERDAAPPLRARGAQVDEEPVVRSCTRECELRVADLPRRQSRAERR